MGRIGLKRRYFWKRFRSSDQVLAILRESGSEMKVLKKLTHGFETIPAEIKNLACIITSFKCLWTMRLPTDSFWFQLTPEYPSTRNQNLSIMKQKFARHRRRKHSGNLRLPPVDFSPTFNREFQVVHYEDKSFAHFCQMLSEILLPPIDLSPHSSKE